MTTHLSIVRAGRKHDLPPKWDDRGIAWGPWMVMEGSVRFHLRLNELVCHKCGSLAPRATCAGVLEQAESDSEVVPIEKWRRLYAERCTDCGHDTVYDPTTDQSWDLDDSDYGDEGSHDEATAQGALF